MSMEAQTQTGSIATNPLSDLTGFQRELLVAISTLGEKPSGQEIKKRWETQNGEETTHGRTYPNLDTLKEKGLIDKGEIDLRTNYYSLSPAGEEDLESYREFVGE